MENIMSEYYERNREAYFKQYALDNAEKKKAYRKEWYQKNKEKKKQYALEHKEDIKAYKKEYYSKNKDSFLQQQRDYYATPENRAKRIYAKARARAKETGIEFTITVQDIVIPTHCPYLGIELTHELGKGQLESNSSLDRIDSTKGYVPGNVQVTSRLANTMKSNASQETLLRFAQGIFEVHGLEGTTIEAYKNAILKSLLAA